MRNLPGCRSSVHICWWFLVTGKCLRVNRFCLSSSSEFLHVGQTFLDPGYTSTAVVSTPSVFHRLKFPGFAATLKAVKSLGGDLAGGRLLKSGTFEATPGSESTRMRQPCPHVPTLEWSYVVPPSHYDQPWHWVRTSHTESLLPEGSCICQQNKTKR